MKTRIFYSNKAGIRSPVTIILVTLALMAGSQEPSAFLQGQSGSQPAGMRSTNQHDRQSVEQFISQPPSRIYFVSDGGFWANWDIYCYDRISGGRVRLTTDPAIDNHPDVSHTDSNAIVFSSNRGNGEFDLYYSPDVNNIDNTAVPLTNDSYPGIPPGGPPDPDPYPDRHPHWHPNGQIIIFTAKNRAELTGLIITSVCSHPTFGKFFPVNYPGSSAVYWVEYKLYEGINVIRVINGAVVNYVKLDVRTAWDATNPDPAIRDIWIQGDSAYCGHPSFNSTGDKIVFTASIDGEGTHWEVYTAGFDPVSMSLIPNSLRRITYGPDQTLNPIKMSGGAKFSNDDALIYFNSTRITTGNSQIYSVPSTALNCPVTNATQITFHEGNDYVPQPLPNSNIIMITSDLGPVRLCTSCETGMGPTEDFDVVLLENGNRTVINADNQQQMSFIPDEVSWFCGTKPNLSSCTFNPRIMDVEGLYLEHTTWDPASSIIPPNLLKKYGEQYCCNAIQMYNMAFMQLNEKLYNLNPMEMYSIFEDIMSMMAWPFPGLNDTTALVAWLDSTKAIRMKKHVIPAVMNEFGLGLTGCPINRNLYERTVPAGCGDPEDDGPTVHHGALEKMQLANYLVDSGGRVDLVAGNRIRLLPNTTVKIGGYLRAWISSDIPDNYCSPPWSYAPLPVDAHSDNMPKVAEYNKLSFRVYPNPSPGEFWVELSGEPAACEIELQVMDFMGKVVLKQTLTITGKTLVSLRQPTGGIYLVKVTRGALSGYDKLIIR